MDRGKLISLDRARGAAGRLEHHIENNPEVQTERTARYLDGQLPDGGTMAKKKTASPTAQKELQEQFSRHVAERQADQQFMATAYLAEVDRLAAAPARALALQEAAKGKDRQKVVKVPLSSWLRAEALMPVLDGTREMAAAGDPTVAAVIRLALVLGLEQLEKEHTPKS